MFLYLVPISDPYMVALDLKSESIKRVSLPFSYGGEQWFYYLPEGNSSIACQFRLSNKDVGAERSHNRRIGKKLYIDGKPIRNELDKVISLDELDRGLKWGIIPRSWLGNGERILFRVVLDTSYMFVYDLKTRGGCCQLAWENGESFSSEVEPLPFVNNVAWVY